MEPGGIQSLRVGREMTALYLAPMEGITGYVFRRAVHEQFGACADKYFTPFFSPHTKRTMTSREIKDILPENNEGMNLIPQILTISAADFLRFEKDVRSFGYQEVNINFGCPSGTVVGKMRGAGFLTHKEAMREFLDEVFLHTGCRVSIKTRLGMHEPEEFRELLELYNRYPIHELIVHLRVRDELYQGHAHEELWNDIRRNSKNPVCYNGDVTDVLPDADTVMIGRGMLMDPSLIRYHKGGSRAGAQELYEFMRRLERDYSGTFSGDVPVLHKLKEIWSYMGKMFPEKEKELKALMKSDSLSEYGFSLRRIISS